MTSTHHQAPATFDVRACRVARLPIPGWEAYFGENDTDLHDLIFYIWLLRNDTDVVLVDAGLPPDDDDYLRLQDACRAVDDRCLLTREATLTDALAAFDVRPADVTHLLITQTITYHTGGITAADLLPSAHVHMAAAGVIEMLTNPPGHPPVSEYFTASSWRALRDLAIEGRLHLVEECVQVAPGLEFDHTGGHHPGSAGIRVRTNQGIVGLLETAFFRRNVLDTMPIGIAEDAAACRAAIVRYQRDCDVVIPIHDPDNAHRFPVAGREAVGAC